MIRRWEMAFWTILAGTTTTLIYTQCGAYGVPTRPDAHMEVPVDPSTEDMADIADLLDLYDIPVEVLSEPAHDPAVEDVEEDTEDAKGEE